MRPSTRNLPALVGAIAALVLAVGAAGCGGDDGNGNATGGGGYGGASGDTGNQAGTAKQAPAAKGGSRVVSVADNPELGEILVDSEGMTLYLFEKDEGGRSSCYGACASVWPPLATSGAPKAGKGAEASMLGTTERRDGSRQVTYNGFPLYTYVGDKRPGDASGNDLEQFGAEWYALTPEGEKPED